MMNRMLVAIAIGALCVIPSWSAPRTQVILLGTGTPGPDPNRSGPATAIAIEDRAYLIDVGPGVVRRASAAAARGVPAVRPENLTVAFVTHLHSDHTVGYPDLIFTPWVVGRKDALQVYGPRGLKAMTDHILQAWQEGIAIRTQGLEHNSPLTVTAHEVRPGLVFSDDLVKVTAFPVLHGEWKDAYGYRFDTPDRIIVISGDARPSPGLIDACKHCDILIHEVYLPQSQAPMPDWPKYRALYHTSTSELAAIARQTQPGLLILYHRTGVQTGLSDEQYLNEVRRGWEGKVVVGHDLEVY
jgi:ribonuclease BN (tRNA processing enzyme)